MTNLSHKKFALVAVAAGLMSLAAAPNGSAQEPVWKKVRNNLGLNRPSAAAAPAAADGASTATLRKAQAPEPKDIPVEAPAAVPAEAAPGEAAPAEAAAQPVPEGEPGVIGLPQAEKGGKGTINLGPEAGDKGEVKSVLDDANLRQMLGENPKFIYKVADRPDPMIYPPIRREAIRSELEAKALDVLKPSGFDTWVKSGKLGEGVNPESLNAAVALYRQVLDLKDARFNALAKSQLGSIQQYQLALGMPPPAQPSEGVVTPTPSPTPELALPKEIAENTLGVLAAADGSVALVGDSLLGRGDEVPGFPEVKVVKIETSKVVFEVSVAGQTKQFDVEVKGYLDLEKVGDLKQMQKNKKKQPRRK